MTSPHPRRARLAARLRAVRAAAFPSGLQFSRHLGWAQSRVSKLETGMQFPTPGDIHAWVSGAGAGEAVEAELLELLAAARVEYNAVRDLARRGGGLAGRQAYLGSLETQITTLVEYQPALIPGIVQTAAYAREIAALAAAPAAAGAGSDEIEAMIAERVRRQEILYQPGKKVQVILGEAALYSRPGSVDTLAGQLDRLLSVTGLSSVQVGVVPLAAPMPVAPLCGFTLLDDEFVLVETMTGEQRLDGPHEIAVHVTASRQLLHAALTGSDAAALIGRVRAGLRSGDGSDGRDSADGGTGTAAP
jgi:hypothetical protein